MKEYNDVLKGITTLQAAEELVESWFLDCISGRPKDAGKTVAEAIAYVIKEPEDEIRRKVQNRSIGTEKDALESMRKYHDVFEPMVSFLKGEFNVVSLRKNYTKTQPLQYEEFADCIKWWNKRTENDRAWKQRWLRKFR